MDVPDLHDWLGLTEQQLDILKVVYNLQHNRKPTTPKNIAKEYERTNNKRILRPNLFNILKLLIDKNIITRQSQGNYNLNFLGIEQQVQNSGAKLQEKIREYEQVSKNAQQYFIKYATKIDRPEVNYLDHDELFQKMAESLNEAEKIHIVANFPLIAYTKELTHSLHREQYTEKLWTKCFKEKKLQVNYLTDLDLDNLFNHAFRAYGDPKIAYKECQTTINRLETQTKTNPKLDIRHLEDPHGLDAAIIETKEPAETYLFIKDEHQDITGGIHIKSKQTTQNALNQYNRNYEYATKLNTPQGQKTLQNLHTQLKTKYGTLEQ